MNTSSPTLQAYVTQVTAPNAGAVAIIQIHGSDTPKLLARITGRATFPPSQAVLTNLAGVDQGLAILWRSDWAQLMPHGGPRVVGRILEYCLQQGSVMRDATEVPASSLYPEARSPLEADMLATMAQAASPLAVQMLLAQPRCWREALSAGLLADSAAVEHILMDRLAMKHLLTPPTVAVLGRPNVGKSTLTNAMLGRSASIVADMPGTTRDWVAGMMQINGLAIRWLDTPGVRTSEDLIEQQAIIMSQAVIQQADVVVAMRDPQTPWPQAQEGGRPVDLWVMNKLDQLADQSPTKALPKDELAKLGLDASQPIQISAQTGAHLAMLNQAILHRLGAAAWLDEAGQSSCPCWAFSPALVTSLQTGDWVSLRAYVTPVA